MNWCTNGSDQIMAAYSIYYYRYIYPKNMNRDEFLYNSCRYMLFKVTQYQTILKLDKDCIAVYNCVRARTL